MSTISLPEHLNIKPADNPEQSQQYDAFLGNDNQYRVFYNGQWIFLEDYLILDPLTRTEEDQELIFKALEIAAGSLARRYEDVGIGPSTQSQLIDLLRQAKHDRS